MSWPVTSRKKKMKVEVGQVKLTSDSEVGLPRTTKHNGNGKNQQHCRSRTTLIRI